MQFRIDNVLSSGTGNSARSIMAEALINNMGPGLFLGCSPGSDPLGPVNPLTRELLKRTECSVEGLRSKSWHERSRPDAPVMDCVLTDLPAGEVGPLWSGQPMTAHWGVEEPVMRPLVALVNA